VVWGVLLFCGTAWGDDRLPVPEGAKVREALGLVREVFAEEYAAAKTGPQKAALAKKILQEGTTGEHDPTSRYALLRVARDLAAIAGDAETALKAVEQLNRRYQVDAIAMKATVLAKVADKVRSPTDNKKLLPVLGKAYDDAVAADRYDVAREIGEVAAASAAKTRDPKAKNSVAKKLKQLKQLEADYAKIKDAIAVLETKPTDPEANLTVGKYRCFVHGDWDDGLPYLALGNDATLRSLAEQELVEPESAADQAKLADGWWELAEKEEGTTKIWMQLRCRLWYEKAAPNVAGLAKVKVDKRLKQLAALERPDTGRSELKKTGPVNLLALIDAKRDAVLGTWRFHGTDLVSPDTDLARVQIPYIPPEEYVVEIVLTQMGGGGALVMGLVGAGGQFDLLFDVGDSKHSTIHIIDGKKPDEHGVRSMGRVFATGKKSTIACMVRKGGVAVAVDGQPTIKWQGDLRRLSLHPAYRVRDRRVLFVAKGVGVFQIHSITLTSITGQGKVLTDGR